MLYVLNVKTNTKKQSNKETNTVDLEKEYHINKLSLKRKCNPKRISVTIKYF